MIPWYAFARRRHCPHSHLRPIYGDEINAADGRRLHCLDCGRSLDGPVALALHRQLERHVR